MLWHGTRFWMVLITVLDIMLLGWLLVSIMLKLEFSVVLRLMTLVVSVL